MRLLNLTSAHGPVLLDLVAQRATLWSAFTLAAQGTDGTLALNGHAGATAAPGLITGNETPAPTLRRIVRVPVTVQDGLVTVFGARLSPAMLHVECRHDRAALHTCTLCSHLTEAPDRICTPCAGAYRHWVTSGGTCPACGEVRIVSWVHEGAETGWAECHACGYARDF